MGFDLAIVGGGPGGYTAAHEASLRGLSVVLFEAGLLGGTCLNRGCIPTKSLLHDAGLARSGVPRDLAGATATRDSHVDALRDGIVRMLGSNGVTVVQGRATITGEGRLSCQGIEYEVTDVIVATGSVPHVPPIPGADLPGVVTSDDLLEGPVMDVGSLVIIGGGVIGVECAEAYAAFGCEVSVLEALPQLLPSLDAEVARRVGANLRTLGIAVETQATVTGIEPDGQGLRVLFRDRRGEERQLAAEAVLVATGRRANTEGLFAEGCAPKLDRGAIVCDERGMSSLPHLYAVGDVRAGHPQLAHVAAAQARNVVAGICGKHPPVDERFVPSCIYTSPEVAQVGLTASEAKAAGHKVRTPKVTTGSNGRSVIEGGGSGYLRLVVDATTDLLLGAQLVCPRATDIVAELALALHLGATAADLAATVHPHPTISEMVMEAALAARSE